jgi:hypothetical protein
VLREIAASVYAPVALIEDKAVANQPLPPNYASAPDEADWDMTAAVVTGDGTQVATLTFNGLVVDDDVSAILFDYAAGSAMPDPDDDAAWTNAGTAAASTTTFTVTGLMAGTLYWGAVSYLVGGARSDRLVIGPVAMPGLSTSTGRLLLEGGGRLLLESGDQLLLES